MEWWNGMFGYLKDTEYNFKQDEQLNASESVASEEFSERLQNRSIASEEFSERLQNIVPEQEHQPEEIPEKIIEPEEIIPDSTDQEGAMHLYYKCDSEYSHNKLNSTNTFGDEIEKLLKKKNFVKLAMKVLLPKFIIGDQKSFFIQKMKLLSPNYKLLNILATIEDMRINDDSIPYGNPEEIKNCTELNAEQIKQHNRNVMGQLYRNLYTFEWSFKLDLPKDRRDKQFDISHITTNKSKQEMYKYSMKKYKSILEDGIIFRKKYYKLMQQEVIINDINMEFMRDYGNLFDELIEYMELYAELQSHLSKKQRKKLETSSPNIGTLNLNFNFNCKSISTYSMGSMRSPLGLFYGLH